MNILNNIILFYIIICLLMFSCKKESKLLKNENKIEVENTIKKNSQILSLKYFDTILNSDTGKGVLKYNKTTKIRQSSIVERHILMYTVINKGEIQLENGDDIEKLDKQAQGAFLDTVGDGTFYFDYKFPQAGNQNITIAFVDLIDYKDSNSNKIRSVYNLSNVSIPVVVIDSNSVLGVKNRKLYYKTSKTIYVKRKDSLRFAKKNQIKMDSIKKVLNN